MSLKIVQAVGWYYPDSLGGTEVYVAELSRRLLAAGNTVMVAAPDTASERERTYCHDGIQVYRYPISGNASRAECQGLTPVSGSDLFHAWLRRQNPDVVHIHTFVTGLGLAEVKASKDFGARVIVTTHSGSLGFVCQRGTMMRWGKYLCDGICAPAKCAACELQHRGLPRPLAQMIGAVPPSIGRLTRSLPGRISTAIGISDLIERNKQMQEELLVTVDKMVLLTRWALEALIANGAPREKLALNPIGVGLASAAKKLDPCHQPTSLPVKVGYFGRFDPIKGVYDLARAIANLPRDLAIRVEFRGPAQSHDDKRVLKELKAMVGDDPRVVFAGPVPPAAALDVLASYDVLCCPSICLEGGPTVAIEAHAVNTPVIGSRIGGLAEIITDEVSGRLFEPGNWRELSGILREIVGDPGGTIDRWRRALPSARTMDQVAADYLSMYLA